MPLALVTSACSYHGRHLVRALETRGYDVIGLDGRPVGGPVDGPVDTMRGHGDHRPARRTPWPTMRPESLAPALARVDAIVHPIDPVHPMDRDFDQPADPTKARDLSDTLALLRAAAAAGVRRFVLQSSLMVYGEGRYIDEDGQPQPARRTGDDLRAGAWQAKGLRGQPVAPMPTPEDAPIAPLSRAAKLCQMRERLVLAWARATGAGCGILRMGRLYGAPLDGDYSRAGEIALIAAHVLRAKAPVLLEDGGQTDDWLPVQEAARAMCQALEACEPALAPLNITTGLGHTAAEMADQLIQIASGHVASGHVDSGHVDSGHVASGHVEKALPLEMGCPHIGRHLTGSPGAAQKRIGFVSEPNFADDLNALLQSMARAAIPDHPQDLLHRLHNAAGLVGPGRRPSASAPGKTHQLR